MINSVGYDTDILSKLPILKIVDTYRNIHTKECYVIAGSYRSNPTWQEEDFIKNIKAHDSNTRDSVFYIWHRPSEEGPASVDTNQEGIITSYQYREYEVIHRYDGPATFDIVANIQYHWVIHGNYVDGDEYKKWLEEMGMDIDNLTPEDKMLIDLKWADY